MDCSPFEPQQQQEQHQQPFDLSQPHPYDPYYGYHHHRPFDVAASYDQQHYYASYYDSHGHAPSHHHQQYPAPAPRDFPASQGIQHRGGGASVLPGGGHDQRASYPTPSALNPAAAAAVAALSQLVQLADAAERTGAGAQERWQQGGFEPGMTGHMMPLPQQSYEFPMPPGGRRRGARGRALRRIGGRRRPFRGRGNGNKAGFSHCLPTSDGRAPFQGRGRGACIGRGRGKKCNQFSSELQSDSAANESLTGREPAETSGQTNVPPQQPVLSLAWCDICRVSCTSLEILEQHKNGKRHKKTVQRLEEMQAQQRLLGESQSRPCTRGFNEGQTQPQLESQEKVPSPIGGVIEEANVDNIVQAGGKIASAVAGNLQESLTSGSIVKSESEFQANVEQSVGTKPEGYGGSNSAKRKRMRLGRGGKRLKISESVCKKQPRLREQPRICTLCNCICETQAVFNSHVAGKKHSSRIRRFQGQAVYGPLNVYIPPNQPSIYDPSGPQPLYFGLQTQEMVPLTANGPHQLSETYGSCQQEHGGQVISMPQNEHLRVSQGIQDQGALYASEVRKDAMAAGVASSATVPEAEPAFTSTEEYKLVTCGAGNVGEAETGSATNESGVLEAEDTNTAEDTIAEAKTSFMSREDILNPGYGIVPAEDVIPGLEIKVQESSTNNETSNQHTRFH